MNINKNRLDTLSILMKWFSGKPSIFLSIHDRTRSIILSIRRILTILLFVCGLLKGWFFQCPGDLRVHSKYPGHNDLTHSAVFNLEPLGPTMSFFAVITIFFAVTLGKAELPEWTYYIISVYVAFHIICYILLTVSVYNLYNKYSIIDFFLKKKK